MNVKELKSVHLIGVGGINMSAVAKLLLASGVRVSGSDLHPNEETAILERRGMKMFAGHAADHIPGDAECVIYTSAVPASNAEREEAHRRGIPEFTNFAFLAQWFADAETILVTGTHGKSTTTALLGCMFEAAGLDPTVIVGSKVPSFTDGNIRIGKHERFLIEGDEYAKHFLEFEPTIVLVNNIEHDHPDIFPTLDDVIATFVELIGKMKEEGVLVVNGDDEGVKRMLELAQPEIDKRHLYIITFGRGAENFLRLTTSDQFGTPTVLLTQRDSEDFWLTAPQLLGAHNHMNVAGAMALGMTMSLDREQAGVAIHDFQGIWRRFEFLGMKNGARWYSDYGHHPTAVAATVLAARDSFPSSRVILCFQPHHRNRTKQLFFDFVSAFDLADQLVLCEIYDVAGRDAAEDADISSQDLLDAVVRHDADRGVSRVVEYAIDPEQAIQLTMEDVKEGDIVIVMGAGDIDAEVRKMFPASVGMTK